MRILIAVDNLIEPDIQSNWALNMAKGLTEAGNIVSIFTANQGKFSENFNSWRVFSEYDFNGYDLIIVNGTVSQKLALQVIPPCKIFVSNLNDPLLNSFYPGADIYISVYEDDRSDKNGKNIPAELIREPINFDEFKSIRPINKELKSVLYMGSSKSESYSLIRETCLDLKARLFSLDRPRNDLVRLFNQVDLVIGNGRHLIEAMACERNVLSSDVSFVDKTKDFLSNKFANIKSSSGEIFAYGFIDKLNFDLQKESNFCGGVDKTMFDKETLKIELLRYDPELGKELRELAKKEYDSKIIINKYIKLYKEWKAITPVRMQKPYDPNEAVKIRI